LGPDENELTSTPPSTSEEDLSSDIQENDTVQPTLGTESPSDDNSNEKGDTTEIPDKDKETTVNAKKSVSCTRVLWNLCHNFD
jgi:hypothetical protein